MNNNYFGVIIACYYKDFHLTKGCIASVRYFMPDVPICLLVDGKLDTSKVEKLGNISIIRNDDLEDPFLKRIGRGYGMPKLIAMWHSPFEYTLVIDSDLVLWGDMREKIMPFDYDCFLDNPECTYQKNDIDGWFFNSEKLKKFDENFDCMKYNQSYYCTGIQVFRKNAFDLEKFKKVLDIKETNKDLFHFGEMGFLNYFIFSEHFNQKLRIRSSKIQTIVPNYPMDYLNRYHRIIDNKPDIIKDYISVLHYPGDKPSLFTKHIYIYPFIFFRMMYLTKFKNKFAPIAYLIILSEDIIYNYRIFKGKVIWKLKRYSKKYN